VDHETIDRINILRATGGPCSTPSAAVPGAGPRHHRLCPPRVLACPQRNLVNGDGRGATVAAASIVAKVTAIGSCSSSTHGTRPTAFARHKG